MTTATTNKPTEAEIKAHQDRLQAAIDTLEEGMKKNTKYEMIMALQLVEEEFKGERDVLGPAKHGNVELVRNRVEQLLGILKSDVGEMSPEDIRSTVEKVRDHLAEVLKAGTDSGELPSAKHTPSKIKTPRLITTNFDPRKLKFLDIDELKIKLDEYKISLREKIKDDDQLEELEAKCDKYLEDRIAEERERAEEEEMAKKIFAPALQPTPAPTPPPVATQTSAKPQTGPTKQPPAVTQQPAVKGKPKVAPVAPQASATLIPVPVQNFLDSIKGKEIEEMDKKELDELKTKIDELFKGQMTNFAKDALTKWADRIDARLASLSSAAQAPATPQSTPTPPTTVPASKPTPIPAPVAKPVVTPAPTTAKKPVKPQTGPAKQPPTATQQPAVKPGPKAVPDIKLYSSKEAYEAMKESPEFKRLIEIISFIKKSGEHFTKGDGQREFYEKQKAILDCKGDYSRAVLDDIRTKFYSLVENSKKLEHLSSVEFPDTDDKKIYALRMICKNPETGTALSKKYIEQEIKSALNEFNNIIGEAKKYADGKDKDSIKSLLDSVNKKEIDKLKEDELKELKDEIENATGGRKGTPEEMKLNMHFNAIDKRLTAIKDLKALNLNDKDIEKMDAVQLMALQLKIDELKAALTSSDIRQFKDHIDLVGNRLVSLGVLTAPKIQVPADMPNEFKSAYEVVATVITDQDKLDKFLNACIIVLQDVRPAFLSANEFVQLKNKLSILKNTSIDDEKREMIKEEAEDIISLVSKASPSEIQDLSETLNIKALLKKITRRDAKLREKIDEMFEILDFDTSTITSDDDREDVQKLQEDIRILLNQEIPDEFFNERTLEKTAKKLSGLRLEDQRREFEKICGGISKKIEYLDRYIAEYKTIKSDQKANVSQPVEQPIPLTQPAVGAAAGAAPTQTEKTEEEKKSEKEKTKKETKEKADTELDKKIQELMGEILIDKSLYSVDGKAKDPASLAVRKIIINDIKAENLPVLIAFLKKPNIAIDPKISELLEEFKTHDKLKAELAKQEWDLQVAKDQLADARARKNVHGVSESEKEKIDEEIKNTLYPAVRKLDDIVKKIKTAMDMKNGTVRYQSTTQLLMMINVFIANRDGKKPSEIDLVKDVESQVDAQREESYGKNKLYHKLFNSLGGVIKPSLTTTLQTLEKDEYLKPIGKEKLTLLAKGWNNRGNVDAWINNLSGSEEEKMTKIVPRVIAYLEIAIRNGNMAYINIASMGRAEGLLKNLKAARHEYVMKKVERYAQGKNLSDIDKMSAYFLELNEATVSEKKISHEIIRNAALKTMGKYGGIGAILGAGGAGILAGGAAVALGLPALIGAGALTKSFSAEKPETKAALRRGAIRGIVASALALGSIPLTGGVGLAVIPALFGTFSPELWKYRKQIGRGTKKTAAWTAPKAWWMTKLGLKLGVVGLTGGLILFNKGARQAMFGSKKTS